MTKDIKLTDIIQSMIGRTLENYYHKSQAVPGDEVFRVEGADDTGSIQQHQLFREAGGGAWSVRACWCGQD